MNFSFFKKPLTLLVATTLILISACSGSSQDNFGGLALYTVRDDMGKDAKATLQKVADAGYVNIEAAGYDNGKFYNMSPEDFKSFVSEIGLTPISSHNATVTLENADKMIADVKAAGFQYFVIPIPPMGHFTFDQKTRTMGMKGDIKTVTDIINTIGKKCTEAGIKLLYHNHDFEFKKNKDGIVPIEYFLENTDPKHVNFQMDLYWVTKAGADPVEYFEKYPGRFKMWHVKDMDEQGRYAPVGTGTIDFGRILDKKEESGMKYYMVEQDMTFDGQQALEAIKISHDGLKTFGFK
ncbi:sugar phosphate isomerase/epimerase [Galbibacter sp. EGI 63066]|uniref:sugar phosphate isomerase/epimerase family protein n=1 Tax=Galbibacter sp. EGI 63066 TaxID=2993559 RepID=UPI002248BC85|nr:sugar phosphate isomerase/epimerase [Galbibacter sp. EGI 63066]MCX2679310.1 sugar phosphate isomerase/epimerase [Galbibacter sp. EGI 63066]